MDSPSDPSSHRICFLLGIDRRSGTNHLYQLLRLHPHCLGLAPIWEDFLLHHSKHLQTYVEDVFQSWNPSWEIDRLVGSPSDLLIELGKTLEGFLLRQASIPSDRPANPYGSTPLRYVTKTPSVEGLNRFFSIFPKAIPIVLIRDGRAVVESGMRSFGWDFVKATQRWKHRARIVLAFQDTLKNTSSPGIILRFEDLITDEVSSLTRIFQHIAVDPQLYDFQQSRELKVLGSSQTAFSEGELHWRRTDKPAEYSPLRRFEHWTPEQHLQFNAIAGEELRLLGYL
ncbi:MAG: sulfotransferase [Pirellula sp.]